MRIIALVAAFSVGVLAALQAHVNSTLATGWNDPIAAAMFSFTSGLVVLSVLCTVLRSARLGIRHVTTALRAGTLPRWQVFGGIIGAFYVGVQSTVVAVLGVALFTVGGVAGQVSSSLLVDRQGWGPAGRAAVTGRRMIAAALAVVAVIIAVSDRFGSASFAVVALLFAVAAGVLVSVQQAINGRVAQVARSPLTAAWFNFILGSAALCIVVIARAAVGRTPELSMQPLWTYTGGLIGVTFIAVSAWAVSRLGVLLLTLVQIAGGLIGALVVDIVFPTGGAAITAVTLIGAALTIVAVSMAGRSTRRPAGIEPAPDTIRS